MVCVAHGRDDLSLDVVLANGTFGSERLLVVSDAVVVVVLGEEAADRQRLAALYALKAALVEVFVGHPQHLARALLLAFGAVDFRFTCRRDVRIIERFV